MKVLHRDLRQGLLRLVPEVPDDLWHLKNLLSRGDRVGAVTFRTPELSDDKVRGGKIEKKRMFLTLEVRDVEYAAFSDRLRILGPIVEGPEGGGSHHAFNVEADGMSELAITKPAGWTNRDLDRVREAEEAARRPVLVIVAIEEGEAVVAEVRQSGIREVATITSAGGGKMYAEKAPRGADPRAEFYGEVVAKIVQARTGEEPLIVVGPGFAREHLLERLRDTHPELAKSVLTEGTGQAGMTGVHEAVKRGLVARVQREAQVARDTEEVEGLLTSIATDGKATYGAAEVARAVEAGAVETLLVTEEAVRDPKVAPLLAAAEGARTRVHVVASGHEAGKKLAGLGGVAARLRYKMEG